MKKKNKGGRPTKLTKNFLQKAEDVLFTGINSIIFTDEELRELINDRLKPEETISDTRWQEWKAGRLKDPIVDKFRGLYKKALKIQKQNLFRKLESDDKSWQRFAWIIERKFSDWNLHKIIKADLTSKGKELVNLTNFRDKSIEDKEKLAEDIIDND